MNTFRSGCGRAAVAMTLAVLVAGCATAATTEAPVTARPTATPGGTVVPSATAVMTPAPTPSVAVTPVVSGGRVIVLADGPDGRRGLWVLGPDAHWTGPAATPGATALGRHGDGVALATGAGIEVSNGPDFATAGTTTALKWPGGAAGVDVVDFAAAADGRTALVTSKDGSFGYGLAAGDGSVTWLTPAPTQPFSPIVAWLDGSRLLALSTDNAQVSRLAVVDPAAHTLAAARALGGVRVFGTSSDGKVVAAATERYVYAGSLASFTGTTEPAPIATLADGEVVWAMALDDTGSKLFMLSGLVGADGTVGSVHELGYTRSGNGWTGFLDSAVPFGRAIDQVYLP